uniref:DegT/DnrJ/EryC1/StrS family aminotransferase n=1 Tax=Polynucleobacter sp. TaxID=2029855 RepID=UPI0040483131
MQVLEKIPIYFSDAGYVRYYSLARYALVDALLLAGAVVGSRVLLPEYLCRDVLAALKKIGAIPIWYEVGLNLSPLEQQENWPSADIVLAVNYFGFPQNLKPFQDYSHRTGATIIEDNAHGFLSQDEDGQWLGCRTNLGIFSIRKTLRIPDGSALWIKSGEYSINIPKQAPMIGKGLLPAQKFKMIIRGLPFIGETLFNILFRLARGLRMLKSLGIELDNDCCSENILPGSPKPWKFLLFNITNLSASSEIQRRRSLYRACAEEAIRVGATPIHEDLPNNCCPYGYSFRGDDKAIKAMKKFADSHKFDMVKWPDLPKEIFQKAPKYYLNTFLINFIY